MKTKYVDVIGDYEPEITPKVIIVDVPPRGHEWCKRCLEVSVQNQKMPMESPWLKPIGADPEGCYELPPGMVCSKMLEHEQAGQSTSGLKNLLGLAAFLLLMHAVFQDGSGYEAEIIESEKNRIRRYLERVFQNDGAELALASKTAFVNRPNVPFDSAGEVFDNIEDIVFHANVAASSTSASQIQPSPLKQPVAVAQLEGSFSSVPIRYARKALTPLMEKAEEEKKRRFFVLGCLELLATLSGSRANISDDDDDEYEFWKAHVWSEQRREYTLFFYDAQPSPEASSSDSVNGSPFEEAEADLESATATPQSDICADGPPRLFSVIGIVRDEHGVHDVHQGKIKRRNLHIFNRPFHCCLRQKASLFRADPTSVISPLTRDNAFNLILGSVSLRRPIQRERRADGVDGMHARCRRHSTTRHGMQGCG